MRQNREGQATFIKNTNDQMPETGAPRWSRLEQPRVSGVATFEWDISRGTTWFSPEWHEITQSEYDWERPNAQEWWAQRVPPEDLAVIQRSCLAMMAGLMKTADSVFRLKRGDGLWRWIMTRGQVTEISSSGAPLIVSGTCVDLTDVLLDKKELKASSSVASFDFHAMLENSPDLFIRLDRNCVPVYINPAIVKYLGHNDQDKALADTLGSFRISSECKGAVKRNVERVFSKKVFSRENLCFTMPDGGEASGECVFWPEFHAEGHVQYAMMQFRDLTEKRRSQQQALLNERRMEALYRLTCMESAPEEEVLCFFLKSVLDLTDSESGFIFIPEEDGSDKGTILWSDDHHDRLFPYCLPTTHLPEDLIALMTDKNGGRNYRNANNGDGAHPLCTSFDGKMPVYRFIIAPGTEDKRVICIAGVCNKKTDYNETDLLQLETFINSAWLIIRRRRYIRDLQEAKDAAEAANRAKNAFLANVSHELRTPLNGVLSMHQLIASMPLGAQQREYLMAAQASGEALLRIISDLLDYSCMESGKMPLAMDIFDFGKTVESTMAVFEAEAASKGLEFGFTIDPAIPRYLIGDEARVRQILFNLVGNAFKFTAGGRITVSCDRLPDDPEGRLGVGILVQDTGIGIPEDKLDWVFDAFTQMANTNRGKHSGTGLGLSIVKHLTAMMGGSARAESQPGLGSRVSCTLFFEMPSPTLSVRNAPELANGTGQMEPMDILIAEDDAVGRFALSAFLQREGHRVVAVEDGKLALEALQLYPFHCIFTDIAMPNMDGIELVERIRAGNTADCPPSDEVQERISLVMKEAPAPPEPSLTDLPIIAVTAHTMIGDRERFLRHGADHYISKPIIKKELDEIIAFVRRKRQQA